MSLKVVQDGYQDTEYSKMTKDQLSNLFRNRPTLNFDFVMIATEDFSKEHNLCINKPQSMEAVNDVTLSLVAGNGISKKQEFYGEFDKSKILAICNCDGSFSLKTLSEKMSLQGSIEPELILEVSRQTIRASNPPSKIIPLNLLVALGLIFITCKKMLRFSSDPSTSLSGKHHFLMDWMLGCQIVNLLGVALASLVVLIFFSYLEKKETIMWIVMLMLEINLTTVDFFLRNVLRYYPTVQKLRAASLLLRFVMLISVKRKGLDWYFSRGILFTEILIWAKIGFFLKVVTKKPGVYKMILGYKSLSGQDSI